MFLFLMNLNRIIERESPTGFTMAQPPFPCFAWQSESSVDAKKLLQAFLEQRPSPQWVMVGDGCVQSNLQLWTAWMSASRRWIRKTSLARSIDAEFLRYLSGTHHVSEAFKRAGVRNEDNSGYVLFLPEASADEEEIDCQIVEYDAEAIELQAKEILELKERLNKIYVKHCGQSLKKVEAALDRDNFMTAEAAKEWGIIDQIVDKRSHDGE